MSSCLTCAFDKKKALRKLEASEGGSTLTLPREEEARILADLARGSSLRPQTQRTSSSARDPHCIVLQEFNPRAPDEITVRRGDCVRELYRDGDWSYVASTAGETGFLPSFYLKPIALLFNTNPAAQEQIRAKTFERNGSCRASVDSRRSTTSWGSSSSDGAPGSATGTATSTSTQRKRTSASSSSSRELWVPPRGKSDTQSQPASRTQSPRPSLGNHGTRSSDSPSNLVIPATNRARPTSCTPTRQLRTSASGSSAHRASVTAAAPVPNRCGSAVGFTETIRVGTRRSVAGIQGEAALSPRRAKSLRNLRVSTAQNNAYRHVRMTYNFEGNNSDELSLQKGEDVVVLNEQDDWLTVKSRTGQQGKVPKCMTTPLHGNTGVPNVEPISRELLFNKPATRSVIRDSVATDITDDSAIATGDEGSLSPSVSRRSSVTGLVIVPETEVSPSDPFSPADRSLSPQFSTLVTRHNSPQSTSRSPSPPSPAAKSNKSATLPGMGGNRSVSIPIPSSADRTSTLPATSNASRTTYQPVTSSSGRNGSLPAMSSTKSAMLDSLRAREAVGDSRPRLVVMFNYTALVADEMDVKAGDIVIENVGRAKAGWVWATLPRNNQEGYIPKAFTNPHCAVEDSTCITAL